MNKLKANGFLVAVASAGAVIAGLFAAWVLPAWSKQDSSRTQIARTANELQSISGTPIQGMPDGSPGTPGAGDIKQWEERRAEYVKDYQYIANFYKASDKVLESYFGNTPQISFDVFKRSHTDEAKKIEVQLRNRNVKVGLPPENEGEDKDGTFGFNWPDLDAMKLGDVAEPARSTIVRELQKRFRICERIGAVCVTPGIQVERLVDVFFFKPLSIAKGTVQRPMGDHRLDYDSIAGDPMLSGSGGKPYDEPYLPDSGERAEAPPAEEGGGGGDSGQKAPPKKYLGQTITFALAVNLPYPEVSKFLAELISSGGSIIINLSGARILVRSQNEPVEEKTVQVPQDDKTAQTRIIEQATKEIHSRTKPLSVQLLVICQVVDFDDAALAKQ